MNRHSFKNILAVGGALALIMTAGALPVSAATTASGDAAIAAHVRETLDHSIGDVAVKVDHGHVYLKGQFSTPEGHHAALDRINAVDGVRGIYDYTEDISGSNG